MLRNAEFKTLLRGVFAVNKVRNWTSAEVLNKIKDSLLMEIGPTLHPEALKVGHGGTLDHTATGVLVVGIGYGCKVLPKLLHGSKKYNVMAKLGTATDTYNETGNVTKECSYDHVTRTMLEEKLVMFQGNILQTPPLYSALKLEGQRIADLTRAGVSVKMSPRQVKCHSIQCVDFSPPFLSLDVHCGGGFYIRSLINDLGNALGTCAHVQQLHRFQQGPFTEKDMLHFEQWTLENFLIAINKARNMYGDFLKRPGKSLRREYGTDRKPNATFNK